MHAISDDDRQFCADFEAGRVEPAGFDHRAHVRLAYIYLAEYGTEAATDRMRASLIGFLRHHGVDPTRYHETLTRAWVLAVRHFMDQSPPARSADAFIAANATLLDSRIMLTHYSAEVLFSADARARFMEPDIDAIPRHNQ